LARKRVRSRKRLGFFVTAALVLAAGAAYANYPVIDQAAIAKITEQIKQMSKDFANQIDQLSQLKASVGFLNEVSSAIGKAANITIPITSSENMASQLRSNLRCLMPKGSSWGIDTDELDFGSICNGTNTYRKAFFISDEPTEGSSGGKLTFEELDARRKEVDRRREAYLADTTMRSMAMSDVQLKQAEETNKAAQELKSAADAAVTEQDRLAVLLNIQITQLRSQAQQTELLAQMLKLQTAMAMNAGLTKEKIATADADLESD
jgi:hypothetical protein